MTKVLGQNCFTEDVKSEDETEISEYAKVLASTTSDLPGDNTRILAFKNKAPAPKDGYQSTLKVLYSQQSGKRNDIVKSTRHIPSAPLKVLDAPEIVDDYCK
jgi:cell division cycle protein 20 (cofactor of APC complex)